MEDNVNKVLGTVTVVILALVIFFSIFSCNYVEPGYVGIKVNLYGEDRGVDENSLSSGYVWYNRWMTKVYEYPTFVQRAVFTQSVTEGSPTDESISFASREGIQVSADVGLHYQIPSENAKNIFVKIRGPESAVREYLKSKMRDAINSVSSEMDVNEIYGEGKVKLLNDAKALLSKNIGNEINIEMLTFVSALRLPENVQTSINMTIQAKQAAIAAENKVAQSKAEAQQKIEEARGRSEAVLLEATKQAEANITLAKSLTPELVNWRALEKWNGVLPSVSGGAVPFIQLPTKKD